VIFSLTRNEPSQPQYPARLSSCLQTLRLRLPSHRAATPRSSQGSDRRAGWLVLGQGRSL